MSRDMDMDFLIEGVIVKNFFVNNSAGWVTEAKKANAEELDKDMLEAVSQCRAAGNTDEAIGANIRMNLRTYGFVDETFPVERWLGKAAAQQEKEDG